MAKFSHPSRSVSEYHLAADGGAEGLTIMGQVSKSAESLEIPGCTLLVWPNTG